MHWKIKMLFPPARKEKSKEAQEFLIWLVEETQIPADGRSWR